MTLDSRQIREHFLSYFAERDHERVASGSLIPANDPTLMFVNAGMVPFKDVFTGKDQRSYRRASSAQKCIRISGKHNDLENVGVTARHHTFFEMLGNFSFGDYFKREAIAYSWDFITRVMAIPTDRLLVSVFGGEGDLHADDEAVALWKDVAGLGEARIVRCGAKDNFWQMGDTGPCGPCTEIYYFVGDGQVDPAAFGEEPAPDGTGWTEIWNLVFMQFDRAADGTLTALPAPSIDTGMGLERLATVKQGKTSNYDTDLLRPLVDLAAELSQKAYGGSLAADDVSMRVIADHARTAAFLIAEGVFPDRDGRSYVLRRVMRRAIRHGHRLGIERPFFHECTAKVVEIMGPVYPELEERKALISDICQQEEDRFRQTLRRGLELLASNQDWQANEGGGRVLPGRVAFTLYDTFGFPLDLQEVIGREQGFEIDAAAFDAEMEGARERSAGSKVGEEAVSAVHRELAQELAPVRFVGYEREQGKSEVVALIRDAARVDRIGTGDAGAILTRETSFYAESGGQVGDRGWIRAGDAIFVVEDTQRPVEGLSLHLGKVQSGAFEVGQSVELEVDHQLRLATRRNHSATHLLHYALRTVLGPQAMQKGSLVGPDRLRFDYSASRPLEIDELRRIEDLVNEKVLANAPIETDVLPIDEAKQRGAIGIFEEKYGAVVRMLRMTRDSIELCGGTHASRTGDIGFFKILSDSGLAAGVRRIEAATGPAAVSHVRDHLEALGRASSVLKAPPLAVVERIERLVEQQRELTREIEVLKRKAVAGGSQDLVSAARDVGTHRVLGTTVDLDDVKALRELADQLRDKLAPAVVLLGAKVKGGKALLVCSVSKELTASYSAGNIIREAAAIVGGGGGGRADFAQAGGSDPSRLTEAVNRVYALAGA